MAHSHPRGGIANRGDAARLVLAKGALTEALAHDPSVIDCYRGWRSRRGLDALLTEVRRFGTDTAIHHLLNAVLLESPTDRAALDEVLRERHVEHRRWLTRTLLTWFQIATYNEINPTDRRAMSVQLGGLGALPKGRAPRVSGDAIVRNVRWYYRREIKRPPDELHVLVEEYARAASRTTEAHSVVRNGIAQAKALLDLITDA
jgi:hypothetical protein